jgi:hypothetical protein
LEIRIECGGIGTVGRKLEKTVNAAHMVRLTS